jgi:hypothetical protein
MHAPPFSLLARDLFYFDFSYLFIFGMVIESSYAVDEMVKNRYIRVFGRMANCIFI